nr:activity-regulated cytoskeleton associated protein 2-like [Helicoverpa armigera]
MAMSNEQFQMFLQTITASKQRTFASCNITYSGKKDTDAVEAFLAAATTYKNVEKLSDSDALQGLPLFYVKKQRFGGKAHKPITHGAQESDVTTKAFIAKKRALFASLPPPALTETQQIDLVFALIRLEIRNRMPRDTVPTFEKLLETARGIEETLQEYAHGAQHTETSAAQTRKGKQRCTFCKNPGHTVDVCRKKKRVESSVSVVAKDVAEIQTQAPSPSQPKEQCSFLT